MALIVNPIPLGTGSPLSVPVANKFVFGQQGGPLLVDSAGNPYTPNLNGFFRLTEIQVIVFAVGTNANFVVDVEGTFESSQSPAWIDCFTAIPTIADTSGITLDSGGIHLTAARALAGVTFPVDLAFPRIRLGIAGDVAAGGSARISFKVSR